MKKVTVVSSRLHVSLAPDPIRIICQMSDGSCWSCDEFGKDWKKETPSNDDLTKYFEDRDK